MKFDLDKIYIDQSIYHRRYGDRTFMSIELPAGLKKLDKLFEYRIRAVKQGIPHIEYSYSYSFNPPKKQVENVWNDTYCSLKKDIIENPHLHNIIKENLVFNLKNLKMCKIRHFKDPLKNFMATDEFKKLPAEIQNDIVKYYVPRSKK